MRGKKIEYGAEWDTALISQVRREIGTLLTKQNKQLPRHHSIHRDSLRFLQTERTVNSNA